MILPPAARLLAAGLLIAVAAAAGKYNPTLAIGDAAPVWAELPGIDGKPHDSTEHREAKAVVVAFTCNTCPYARDAEARLAALAKGYAGRPVAVVAINSNAGPADGVEAMAARAKEQGFEFPYLKDDTGAVAKAFGATRTPEFFVLDADRKVAYTGALDDSPKGDAVKIRYVEDAVRAVLDGGAPAVTETPPVGCGIKFRREPRVKPE